MSEPNLKAEARKLGYAANDLAAARALVETIRDDSPDVQTAANLAVGIDALLIRAGRAIEQISTSWGESQHWDWEDYPPYKNGAEEEESAVKS